jgi:hypothetical protein
MQLHRVALISGPATAFERGTRTFDERNTGKCKPSPCSYVLRSTVLQVLLEGSTAGLLPRDKECKGACKGLREDAGHDAQLLAFSL